MEQVDGNYAHQVKACLMILSDSRPLMQALAPQQGAGMW